VVKKKGVRKGTKQEKENKKKKKNFDVCALYLTDFRAYVCSGLVFPIRHDGCFEETVEKLALTEHEEEEMFADEG
jgi:hypothetical protein